MVTQTLFNTIAAFFQAAYEYSRTIVSDYVPQPHDWLYVSTYRPVMASWARIPEAHYIQVDARSNNGVHTFVAVPYELDAQIQASYELELYSKPE